MAKTIRAFTLLTLFFTILGFAKHNFKIIPVTEWGGTPPPFTLPEHQISRITIHHGGVTFTADQDVNAYLKHLQTWSRSEKGWMDIPYHYLIDLQGRIYEGRDLRYPGDTNTQYDPTGHALICLIGNYEEQEPNETQLHAIAWLCARLSKKYQIPLTQIKAHKDYTKTACPGKHLYAALQNGTLFSLIRQYLKTE